MSRMRSSDHLSPMRSRVRAMGQTERHVRPVLSVFLAFIRGSHLVTCLLQVIMLRCDETCKMQVSDGGHTMSKVLASQSSTGHGIGLTVAAALAVWFVLVFVLGAVGAFPAPAGTPPLPIFVGVVAPIVAFFSFYRLSAVFRD